MSSRFRVHTSQSANQCASGWYHAVLACESILDATKCQGPHTAVIAYQDLIKVSQGHMA